MRSYNLFATKEGSNHLLKVFKPTLQYVHISSHTCLADHGVVTIQVGYREPHIWTDVLQGAAELLEEGGILFMYDTET